MESNSIHNLNKQSLSPTTSLLPQKPKSTPHVPPFLQALKDAMPPVELRTYQAEPGALSRAEHQYVRPELTSLNPAPSSYEPQPAALERAGQSRISSHVVGG